MTVASISRRLPGAWRVHPAGWMRTVLVLLACLWLLPLCAQEMPTSPRTRTVDLPPGEYLWKPLAPNERGPPRQRSVRSVRRLATVGLGSAIAVAVRLGNGIKAHS